MKEFNSLESMRYYRERLILPHDPSNKQKGSVVYFLNTSKDSIAQMMNNDHPIISNMGMLYKTYYYDHTTLVRCIKSNRIKGVVTTLPKAKAARLVDYADIESKVTTIRTPIMMHSTMGYNMVYDMSPVERLYSEHPKIKKFFITAKLTSFFDTFEAVYQHELVSDNPYTKYHVMVNLDEYADYVKNGSADNHIRQNILLGYMSVGNNAGSLCTPRSQEQEEQIRLLAREEHTAIHGACTLRCSHHCRHQFIRIVACTLQRIRTYRRLSALTAVDRRKQPARLYSRACRQLRILLRTAVDKKHNNICHRSSHTHHHRHTRMAQRQNILQHHLPRRHNPLILCTILSSPHSGGREQV